MGSEPCAYKSASGRSKWPNRDPIDEIGFEILHHRSNKSLWLFTELRQNNALTAYGFVSNDPLGLFDAFGLCDDNDACEEAETAFADASAALGAAILTGDPLAIVAAGIAYIHAWQKLDKACKGKKQHLPIIPGWPTRPMPPDDPGPVSTQ
jgi:hypothetical protein